MDCPLLQSGVELSSADVRGMSRAAHFASSNWTWLRGLRCPKITDSPARNWRITRVGWMAGIPGSLYPNASGSQTNFRHWLGQAHDGWDENDSGIRDLALNILCKQVQRSAQGIRGEPATDVWQDDSFANICSYDFYNRTGQASLANSAYSNRMSSSSNDRPSGSNDVFWFRDWHYPLRVQMGNSLAFYNTFFGFLNEYFPTVLENGGANLAYVRKLDVGEYVHFMSAAVGQSLVSKASTAFNSGWIPSKFATARVTFPALNSMYTYP